MMAAPAANKIHTLPVLVNYHLPSSSSTFTTLFATPQQVYIHANASKDANEIWGSIYLKSVVQGVMLASPELASQPDSPDTSIYVLDPRETFHRRQRASLPLRPATDPSAEVWAGKGLLSWALNEAGQGKNLVTGRLTRSVDFAGVSVDEGVGALEALMRADVEAWGLEVNLSLRSQGHKGPAAAVKEELRRPVLPSETRAKQLPAPVPAPASAVLRPVPIASSSRHSSPAPGSTPHAHRKPGSSGKKRKSQPLDEVDNNRAVRDDPPFPSIPAALYNNPASLTKDQAHRLLASPAFLELLERTTGTSIGLEAPAKRVKHDHDDEGVLKCWNCGRTKSSVWRSRTMEDGTAVRVCNACGLYWNQKREMRPPSMWSAVDDDVTERPRVKKPTPGAFKRTLSSVAEQDAKRIASIRKPAAKSSLQQVHAVTSPAQPRATGSRTWKAASSPGYAPTVPASDGFEAMPIIPEDPVQPTWDTDISTLFDVDAFSERLDPTPVRRSPRKHTSSRTSDRDEDAISNLFQSSTGASPKSTFDFSALPPSSPPVLSDFIHFSSPDYSPASMFGPSPAPRLTPEKASGLRHSFTPTLELPMERLDSAQSQVTTASCFQVVPPAMPEVPMMNLEEMTRIIAESGFDQAAWDELIALAATMDGAPAQGYSEDTLGHDEDWSMLLNSLNE